MSFLSSLVSLPKILKRSVEFRGIVTGAGGGGVGEEEDWQGGLGEESWWGRRVDGGGSVTCLYISHTFHIYFSTISQLTIAT